MIEKQSSERLRQRTFIISFPVFIKSRNRQQLRPPIFQAIFIVSDRKDVLLSPGELAVVSQRKRSRAALPFLDNCGEVKPGEGAERRLLKPEKGHTVFLRAVFHWPVGEQHLFSNPLVSIFAVTPVMPHIVLGQDTAQRL